MEVLSSVSAKLLGILPHLTFSDIISFAASQAMIFGGVVPYIPQYLDIKRTKNAEGFSTFVCLTLLIANTLRILFWFGHPFELPLLLQSIVMILAMLLMIQLCTITKVHNAQLTMSSSKQYSESKAIPESLNGHALESGLQHQADTVRLRAKHQFIDFDHRHFWQWTDFQSYLQFMALFASVFGLITWIFVDNYAYIEILGFLAVLTEALLGAPQFYRNYCNKSTAGMSVKMVLMWLSGDIFKTGYFLLRHAPVQFWLCGILQVLLDVSILLQVAYYKVYPLGFFKSAVQ